ncbi:MerR family transcriptional regulator [Catenuloplanes sp. NPDC051500]|uniref:MerR family transcriptional regulator n=1 Tax=Catenuloplanes sp. NPDC051500 TaxID=3363959 RepID=UPI00379B5D36
MSWSTAQVARIAGVSSRTLRHYDDIGLLRPARVSSGGLRHYETEQLLRLQQIMLLRELGLSLETIGAIVSGEADRIGRLRRHHRWLIEERDRFDRLADTVRATISQLEGGEEMSTEQLFEGFDADRQARYEAELVERYGEGAATAIAESKQRTAGGRAGLQREWTDLEDRLVALLGSAPESAEVQAVIADHHRWIARQWTPDRESYTGLGRLYVESPDFKARFDARDPRLAPLLRDAIAVYAQVNME